MSRQHPHIHRRKLFRRRLKRAMHESRRRNVARIDANLAKLQADPTVHAMDKLKEKGLTFFEKTKTHERLCVGRSSQKTAKERSEDLRRACTSKLMRRWYRSALHSGFVGTEAARAWNRRHAAHAIANVRFWIHTGKMPDLYTDLTHRRMLKPKKRSRRQRQREQAQWDQMMGRLRRGVITDEHMSTPAYQDTPGYIEAPGYHASAAPAAVSEPVAVVIEQGMIRSLE